MSITSIDLALQRIYVSPPDRPILIFAVKNSDGAIASNKVDACFGHTLSAQHEIKYQSARYIGVFHNGLNPDISLKQIKKGIRRIRDATARQLQYEVEQD